MNIVSVLIMSLFTHKVGGKGMVEQAPMPRDQSSKIQLIPILISHKELI